MEPVSGPHAKAKMKETRAIIVTIGDRSRRSITRISSATRASRHSVESLLCDPETFHCFGSGKSYPWRKECEQTARAGCSRGTVDASTCRTSSPERT